MGALPLLFWRDQHEQQSKNTFHYIVPALGGLFVTYLYNVVDGIFVGRGVGAAALGAVNIAVPFITSVVAIAAMFPMGGATVVAIRMGRGDKKGANHAFMTAFSLTLAVSVLLTIIGMVFSQQIVDLSGGSELSAEMREMARQYLFYCCAFSVPMLMSTCLSVFVRNDGSPTLSFVGMCVGAAVASGLGQILAVLVLLTHFLRKKGDLRIRAFRIDLGLIRKICKRGVPEAVTQLTTPVTALCYNLMLSRLVGDIGVSTFSVLSFLFSTKRTEATNVIVISRGIVIKTLAVFLLPILFGTETIWLAPLAAEIITLILAVILDRQCTLRYQ